MFKYHMILNTDMSSLQLMKKSNMPLIIALSASTIMALLTFAYINFMIYDISYGMTHVIIKDIMTACFLFSSLTMLYDGFRQKKNANTVIVLISFAIVVIMYFIVMVSLEDADVPFLNACQTIALMDAISVENCLNDETYIDQKIVMEDANVSFLCQTPALMDVIPFENCLNDETI